MTGTSVVVVNQHGDNRGDEAAMAAMVRGLGRRLTDPSFTIVHQFAEAASEIPLAHPVEYLTLRLRPDEFVGLFLSTLLDRTPFPTRRLLTRRVARIVDAVDAADLVVSAPGGPYFGDHYADHELFHWLFIWLAHRSGKPIGLYAPSCGPFENRLLNPLRRRGFRWFDRIVLREARSAAYLRGLDAIEADVTADSALQDDTGPCDRTAWASADERLLVVSVREPSGDEGRHDRAVVAAIDAVAADAPTSVVFLPQLHGPRHRDAPYLGRLAAQVTGATRVGVAPEAMASDEQRALVGGADLVIAGRYHPAVFAISSATPVLVIPYEHKAMGLAEAAGIEEWTVWVDDLRPDDLAATTMALLRAGSSVHEELAASGARLRQLSCRTSELISELVSD